MPVFNKEIAVTQTGVETVRELKHYKIPMFQNYNHLTDFQIIHAVKIMPIISSEHMFLIVIYPKFVADPADPSQMIVVQMVHMIDSSDSISYARALSQVFMNQLTDIVLRFFDQIFSGRTIRYVSPDKIQVAANPVTKQFIETSFVAGHIYAHLSILLHDHYDTDDIFLRSAIKMIKDKTGDLANPNPIPNPNPNPNPNPVQADNIYTFYFSCLLQMVSKTNHEICSGMIYD